MDGVTFGDRMYPSAYDMEDSAAASGVAVSEIQGTSALVFDAAIGTTSGYRYDVQREVERNHTAHPAAFDEGWTMGTDSRYQTVSFDTMRVIDARPFDKLVSRGVSDNGNARRAILKACRVCAASSQNMSAGKYFGISATKYFPAAVYLRLSMLPFHAVVF